MPKGQLVAQGLPPSASKPPSALTDWVRSYEVPNQQREAPYVVDPPTVVYVNNEPVIQATARPALSMPWLNSSIGSLPLATGALHIALVDPKTHTEVLDDEIIGIHGVGRAIHIYSRVQAHRDPWNYEGDVWQRVLQAICRPTGLVDSPADQEVSRLAQRSQELSGLSDSQLAELFPGEVRRETYNRWKNGHATNPTPGNLRRLTLLHRFFKRLASRVGDPRAWLLAPLPDGEYSPYDLLREGRLDKVEEILWRMKGEEAVPSNRILISPSGMQDSDHALPSDEDDQYVEGEWEDDDAV